MFVEAENIAWATTKNIDLTEILYLISITVVLLSIYLCNLARETQIMHKYILVQEDVWFF